ncbi:hypothetical protein EV44_g3704 [Erysiphe necator]|uniref:Uncharacterized protein n=1 Tax=Uncinula necator TaxID=52586 RepID=A0A0B1P454_UNCNE|nr:hypothetical protein EV44_g3704 [Erysiphe necator]
MKEQVQKQMWERVVLQVCGRKTFPTNYFRYLAGRVEIFTFTRCRCKSPDMLCMSGIAKKIRTILPFRTPFHHRGSQSSSFLHHFPLNTFFHQAPHDWPREYKVKGSILSQRTSDENKLLA